MPTLSRESPAKINLTLRVCGPRPDGFHEIESLIARVGLCDQVTVRLRDDGRFTVACDDPTIPCDQSNLAWQAADRLATAAGVRRGADISLKKRIPAGAGLGGGSSNAASVLMLLNELWKLGLPRDELATIGAEIGSDVPLFFHSPLCVVRGRGEIVEDLDLRLGGWAVLVLPRIHVSTAEVYAAWGRMRPPASRPAVDGILAALVDAGPLSRWMPHLFNDLEEPALSVSPELAGFAARLREHGPEPVRMSGSGCAFFSLFDEREATDGFAKRLRQTLHPRVEVVPAAANAGRSH